MEYQFETTQVYNRKMHLEFNYRVWCRPALIWGLVSLLLLACYVRMAQDDPYWWVGVVAFAGLAVHYFTWPYRLERKRFKRVMNYYDGSMPVSYIRFGDKISVKDGDSVTGLEYRKIEKVIILKHGLFLRYAKKSYLGIDPREFTVGTYEEFKRFLREKCPNAKIPN